MVKVVDGVRLHIFGGSGTGTSTLARGMATRLSTQCFDTDDFFWVPSDPAFAEIRSAAERRRLMEDMFLPRRDWVVSGSMFKWADPVVARLTHAVFLTLDPDVRMARLEAREAQRYGDALPEGNADFMAWAAGYDDPDFSGRNIREHRDWAQGLPVPVVELDGALERDALIEAVVDGLGLAS